MPTMESACRYDGAPCSVKAPNNAPTCTGKERDTESGLDYFGARYYASSMGRWMSPDWADKPEAVPYSDLANPQSLNLYGYVKNNPLRSADPDGHDEEGDPQQGTTLVAPPAVNPTKAEIDSAVNSAARQLLGDAIGGALSFGAGVVAVPFVLTTPAGNYNDDHPNAQTRNGQPPSESNPVIEPQTSSGGAMKGGGRNGQKANADRVQSAKDNISDLKGQRDTLSSKANKTPADKANLKKLDNQIKQQQDRMKPSENHSQKGKGQ